MPLEDDRQDLPLPSLISVASTAPTEASPAKVQDEDSAAKIPSSDNSTSESLRPGFKLRVILTLALFVMGITGLVMWWFSR
jgi:hypothetical protein